MQIFRNKNLLFTLVAVLVLSITAYFFYPSVSYAADITSLPADVDCTVEYDATSFTFTVGDVTRSFQRDYSLSYSNGSVTVYPDVDTYSNTYIWATSDFSGRFCQYDIEHDYQNKLTCTSYWYSPSTDRLFIFRNQVQSFGLYNNVNYIVFAPQADGSPYKSNFGYSSDSRYNYTPEVYLYDYNLGYLSFSTNPAMTTFNGCKAIQDCPLFVSSFPFDRSSSTSNYYKESIFDCKWISFPSDMLCVFANYDIPGYFELSTDKVITPSYYFKYQYLYFKSDTGYIFIDSSSTLKGISMPTFGSAVISFSSKCNSHIYYSSDGITWSELTTVGTMYGSSFSVTYSYFYSGSSLDDAAFAAALLYCNDDTMEKEPQFKPTDFPDPTDISVNLNSILNSSYVPLDSVSNERGASFYCVEFPDYFLSPSFSLLDSMLFSKCYYALYQAHFVGSDFESKFNNILGYPGLVHCYFFVTDPSDFISVPISATAYAELLSSLSTTVDAASYLGSVDGSGYSVFYDLVSYSPVNSLGYYSMFMSNSLGNIDTTLQVFRNDVSLQLGSIHGNISSVVAALNTLDDDIKGIKFDDSGIVKAIKSLNIPSSFDDSGIIDAVHSLVIPPEFDDSAILDAINNISINVSGGSVDVDSGLLGDLCDVFDDDGDDSNGLYTFVSDTLEDVSSSINFSEFITFSDDLMSGISFTNNLVGSIYNNLGDLKPVVLCGAGFTLVAIVLKKERAT